MELWSSIDAENIHLATIRVYHQMKCEATGRTPKIVLILPPPAENPNEPGDEYELEILNEDVANQFVIAEREKEPGTGSRARTTILTGRVKHECNLKPMLTDKYRQRLKMRNMKANMPTRTIKRIEDEHPGDRGSINRLTSGVTNTTGFADLVVRARLAVHVCTSHSAAETKTEACERPVRAHGPYTAQPAARRLVYCVPRARALVCQAAA